MRNTLDLNNVNPSSVPQHQCQSEGNAFVFGDRNQSVTYGTTRDLNLETVSAEGDVILSEDFESGVSPR